MTDNSVLVKGDPLQKDGQSAVQLTPGELAGHRSNGKLEAGGTNQPRFIKESPPEYSFADSIAAGYVEYYLCRQGDEVRAFVNQATGGEKSYDPEAPLYDGGDGTLDPEGSGEVVAYIASEDGVTLADDTDTRVRVEVA